MMLLGEQAEPRSYEEHKRRILAGFSETQQRWEREAGARLVVSKTAPYFSYTRDSARREWAA
jgi:hypothetical protein